MAQSGQVRQKITEQQLIGLLDQVEGQGQAGSGGSGGAGKITVSGLGDSILAGGRRMLITSCLAQYTRKKTLSDDEDDFDL